ncbi:hypothetical protein GCM10010331_58640 [Streptomyces xanthochromogenes]|uniref:Uncharacterized protein n=1 Tax=Streptomyces xanthochromogenes TaxID=67384 RepID=A0ABQ3AGQ9_9ACTN|nr:hypothetical protein GCM10010326_48580 [Streptomyces xanthochromogenes]GHB63114.1 hypothetical protein GCM10010331_58640 [Streptomyces xanthochromogenes]
MRFWSISSQSLCPSCSPTPAFSSSADVKILGSAMSLVPASRDALAVLNKRLRRPMYQHMYKRLLS